MRAMVGVRTVLLLLAAMEIVCAQDSPTVNVNGVGELQGTTAKTDRQQRSFFQFLGVPYAQVTTRFQAPPGTPTWTGTRDATAYGPVCIQFGATGGESLRHPAADVDPLHIVAAPVTEESEDCLTMDIHTPNITAKLPVLVYIHGGAFVMGSSQQVNPGFLLDYDIVLVALQYRLGPLGFLSLQTAEVPGNAGLMDQLAALQWVHDHIAQFGGDPAKVTLAGGSAGAASTALLQLSPRAQDLFQQVYLESGSALAPWSVEDDPVRRAMVIAANLSCTNTDLTVNATCLQGAPLDALKTGFIVSAVEDMLSGGTGLGGALPVVEQVGNNKVIADIPLNAIKATTFRALPMLVGVSKHEGIMPLGLLTIYKNILVTIDTDIYGTKTVNDLVRRIMMIDDNRVATDAVADKYFKPGTLDSTDAMRPSLIDLAGAVHFKGPAITTLEYNSKAGKDSYFYSFNHQDEFNFEAVNHGGDFPYLFPTLNLTDEEVSVSQKMVELLVNFVTYGNPTPADNGVSGVPTWKPYKAKDPNFMLVDKTPQLRQDFERQLTIAATEGLQKQTSSASAATTCLALLAASVTAALSFH